MARATARHILVSSEARVQRTEDRHRRRCRLRRSRPRAFLLPSGRDGGNLGSFGPGQMVREFDQVVFSAPLNVVQGPVKTQFGYHLLEVTSRQD